MPPKKSEIGLSLGKSYGSRLTLNVGDVPLIFNGQIRSTRIPKNSSSPAPLSQPSTMRPLQIAIGAKPSRAMRGVNSQTRSLGKIGDGFHVDYDTDSVRVVHIVRLRIHFSAGCARSSGAAPLQGGALDGASHELLEALGGWLRPYRASRRRTKHKT